MPILDILCPDLAGLVLSYLVSRCARCKQVKSNEEFNTTKTYKQLSSCIECCHTLKLTREIKRILKEEIEDQGLRARLPDGEVLKVKFDRFKYGKIGFPLFNKTVKTFMESKYSNELRLKYSTYDDLEDHFKVLIVDPNHSVYRTEQFFKQNFTNMRNNPQNVFTIAQMDQPVLSTLGANFNEAKKIKIETQMYGYILKRLRSKWMGVHYDVDSKEFGQHMKDVDVVRAMEMGSCRDDAFSQLAETIQTETMKTIDLPATGCTVLQLLNIIENNWPKLCKADNEHYWIDGFSLDETDPTTIVIGWAC
jgi:hypothetical protein